MPIVLKSGSLKLLEPSGPVQACNGIAFFTNLQVTVSDFILDNIKVRDIYNVETQVKFEQLTVTVSQNCRM